MSRLFKHQTTENFKRPGIIRTLFAAAFLVSSFVSMEAPILATPASAAESMDYEWDPSGVFTRSMRGNAPPIEVELDEETPAAQSQPARRQTQTTTRAKSNARSEQKSARKASLRQARTSKRRKRSGTQVASLGAQTTASVLPRKSLSGGGGRIIWQASSRCLNSSLRSVIAAVAANYGQVRVNSTCRSKKHNRRVGGASRSYHLTGDAADIRILGNWRSATSYLRSAVGGYKHYGGGRFHIDTGPRRRF